MGIRSSGIKDKQTARAAAAAAERARARGAVPRHDCSSQVVLRRPPRVCTGRPPLRATWRTCAH
eukprot:1515160-Lingulodinium_polyedra.AAC.1